MASRPGAAEWAAAAVAPWATPAPLDAVDVLLLQVSCVAFALTGLLAVLALLRVSQAGCSGDSPVAVGARMRRRLAFGLLGASVLRVISYVVRLMLGNGLGSPGVGLDAPTLRWALELLELLPCFVFLSSFTVVGLFCVQLHYTVTMVPVHMLDCAFVFANVFAYLLLGVISVCTTVWKLSGLFRAYVSCFVGLLNVVVALLLLYFGLMAAFEVQETSRKKLPAHYLHQRLALLSVLCPGALLARGVFLLAWSASLRRPSRLFSLALCLVGEWLPAMAALVTIGIRSRPGARPTAVAADSSDARSQRANTEDSTDSESPLLQNDEQTIAAPPRLAGAPGSAWKQLYPQPASQQAPDSGV